MVIRVVSSTLQSPSFLDLFRSPRAMILRRLPKGVQPPRQGRGLSPRIAEREPPSCTHFPENVRIPFSQCVSYFGLCILLRLCNLGILQTAPDENAVIAPAWDSTACMTHWGRPELVDNPDPNGYVIFVNGR